LPSSIVAVYGQYLAMLDGNGTPEWQVSLPAAVGGAPPDRLTLDGDTAYVTFHSRPDGPAQVDVVAFALN
jgi:hypothetical protein